MIKVTEKFVLFALQILSWRIILS